MTAGGPAQVSSAPTPEAEIVGDLHLGRDDHALGRIPETEREHWLIVFLQR